MIADVIFFCGTEICVYNGQAYRQGQEWYDGCDKKCVCVDAKTGYYSCRQR